MVLYDLKTMILVKAVTTVHVYSGIVSLNASNLPGGIRIHLTMQVHRWWMAAEKSEQWMRRADLLD